VLTLADVAADLRPIGIPIADDLAARGFADVPGPLGALVYHPTLYRRNGVAWSSVRSWRADAKGRDLARFKLCKAALDGAVIAAAAAEIAAVLQLLFGPLLGWSATTSPVGTAGDPTVSVNGSARPRRRHCNCHSSKYSMTALCHRPVTPKNSANCRR
jgi:hypothetical protein